MLKRRPLPLPLTLAALSLALACGEAETPSADAGATADTGVLTDAGPIDAGVREDAGPDDAGVDPDTPITQRFKAVADTFEAERVDLGAPGAALLIMEGGEVTFARGFGTKRPDGGDPVKSTTLFRIGSVTKMMTATALLQEVEAGRLSLDDSLGDALPGLSFARGATWSQDILLRHLISHTAGFLDYLEVDQPAGMRGDEQLAGFLLGTFAQQGYVMAPPGAFYNYSNPNFMYAGLVAERSANLGYRELMQSRVFAPLGMSRTFFLPDEVLADGDYAVGRTTDDMGRPAEAAPDAYDNPWARPAGYAFSSVWDLARFVRFVRDGDAAVLADDLRAQLTTAQVNTREAGDLLHYGFGWFVYDGILDGQGGFVRLPIITHGGAIPGFAADVYWMPTLDLAVITLANTDGAYFRGTLQAALTELTTLPTATTAPDIGPRASDLPLYVGSYLDAFNAGRVNITQQDGDLVISMPDVDAAGLTYQPVLTPIARHNFVLSVEGLALQVTFLGDEGQPATWLRTRPFVATRTTTARPAAVAVDRASLLGRLRAAAREAPVLRALTR
ncbi:MAG: beta-lactamase family protein [Deltaproteobacteria bacterium]|nr:beta-lactamase family protein [Deltaproteobacteria bacterium]